MTYVELWGHRSSVETVPGNDGVGAQIHARKHDSTGHGLVESRCIVVPSEEICQANVGRSGAVVAGKCHGG